MAISQVIHPYEILVSFDKNGTMKGAHLIRRSYLVNDVDGSVISEADVAPEPLSIENLPDQGIMNDAQISAIDAAMKEKARADSLKSALEEEEANSSILHEEINSLKTSIVKAAQTIEQLQLKIAELERVPISRELPTDADTPADADGEIAEPLEE